MQGIPGRLVAVLVGAAMIQPGTALLPGHAAGGAPKSPLVSVIVTLEEQASLAGVDGATRRQRGKRVIEELQQTADSTQPALQAFLEAQERRGAVHEFTPFWVFNGLEVTATTEVVARLARRPEVLKVTPNSTIAAEVEPEASNPEANIALVRAPELWNLGLRGEGVVVASMDTGVDVTHPDLAAQWRGGANSWFDPHAQHPTTPTDMSGHGTRTMGVMVGSDAGGTDVGIAPNARWIAVKVFDDSGTATVADIHAGFQWLLDPDGDPATADAPHVVNNSWTFAGPGCNPEFQLDLQALRSSGIVPVFAAGNYGPLDSTSRSPANNPEALAVGATTNDDTVWTSSSRGPSSCVDVDPTYPDMVAPGSGIRTTDRFGGYATVSGTSLAAPHVTGALALLRQGDPEATADQLEHALEGSALDLGVAGPDQTFGHGRLDILAARERLRTVPDFTLSASPAWASTAQGGLAGYTVAVARQNGFDGDVELSVTGLPGGAAAAFTPNPVDPGSGSADLTVTTSAATPVGTYALTITGTAGSVARSTAVTLLVDPPPSYTLGVSPESATTRQGGTATFDVSIASLHGFTGDVALSVDGLPAAATASFTPPTVVGGAGSSQLTVTTSASTPLSTSVVTVTATSGQTVRSASVVLTVEPVATTLPVASVKVLAGSLRGGSALSLRSDDDDHLEVASTPSGTRTTAWRGDVPGVPNSLSAVSVTYQGRNSRACRQTVSLWRWTTGSWVVIDSRTVGPVEVLAKELVPSGPPGDYVSGTSGDGQVRVRLRCTTRSGAFLASADLLVVGYTS